MHLVGQKIPISTVLPICIQLTKLYINGCVICTYILYNMTICSAYPIENYNLGMGGDSNFARPMLPTYRGCTDLQSSYMLNDYN